MKLSSIFSLPNLALSVTFLLISAVSRPCVANATSINVNNASDVAVPGLCNLRQAIVSHNEKAYVFPSSCAVGDGDDTIYLNIVGDTIDLGSPLNPIESGRLLIIPGAAHRGCLNLRQAAYITVRKGATLNLASISIVVNGAEPRSIIDNDGGTLGISHGSHACVFSNQSGKVRKTSLGGVLHNRNGGFARIDANFENSSAGDKGGAIYVDSGTVQIGQASIFGSTSSLKGNSSNQGGAIYVNTGTLSIEGGTSFNGNSSNQGGAIYVNSGTVTIVGGEFSGITTFEHNSSNQGGAIYVNSGATLNVASNDFAFVSNRADGGGGGIYSNGGNVTVMPTPPLRSASIRFNSSVTGAAIYAAGGQLSVDRAEINNNRSSGSGGAIVVSDIKPPTPALITRSYFQDNSAGVNGGALYALDGSTLNLSASTFTRDRASGLGGGVYVDTLSNLNVLNSTFLGGVNREGIVVASGLGNVVFSTIVGATLGVGSTPTTHLSNSILREVTCAAIVDEGLNLQFQSTGCPVSVPSTNPLLDGRFLEDNGGPTPTIALLPGSPAINAIAIGDCVDQDNQPVKTDQRGFGRPDPADPGHCDIGAYEFGATH
jgi:predicted outer membrane repeat protein